MAVSSSDESNPATLCHIVTPVGMLGYGFEEEELDHGLRLSLGTGRPTAVILDSGSTDSGPSKLALGETTTPRSSYVRDLRKLIKAIKAHHVPLLISSAGGDGSNAHVKEFLEIIGEIVNSSEDEKTKLKVIAIYSEVSHHVVIEKLQSGKISGCGPCVPPLKAQDVEATPTIVGQMGPEPFMQAMAAHPDFDIIIGGRAYDPAPYVAFCAFQTFKQQYHPIFSLDNHVLGEYTHMGKIMECGGLCATPKSQSSMATIYQDGTFDIRPLSPGSVCTPVSVAAHTLYEKSRPDQLSGPGGYIDLMGATYTPLEDGLTIRVQGTVFKPSKELAQSYTVKLEGAKVTGYRSIFLGSFADPILISQLPSFLERVKQYAAKQHQTNTGEFELDFHIYGLGRTSSPEDPGQAVSVASGVFVVGEALAKTQELARGVVSTAKIACVHGAYEGQKATSGNLGMGIGGMRDFPAGPCAEFSIYHLMDLNDGEEEAYEMNQTDEGTAGKTERGLFKWEMVWIGTGDRIPARSNTNEKYTTKPIPETKVSPKPPRNADRPPPRRAMRTLGDAANVIRSKNAGPYEITFDVIFDDEAVYNQIKKSGILTSQRIAQLYDISEKDIVYCGFFDPAMAFKATIPRMRNVKPTASGGYMENDVHGSQKYLPLMNLRLEIGQ